MLFGFAVHPVTLDPTVLKINSPYYSQDPWYESVFTLSSRTWFKLESYCLPHESIRIKRSGQAVVGGKIFWVGSEKFYGDDGISHKLYMLVSFDLILTNFSLHVEPSSLTQNSVTIILGPPGIVQLSSSTRIEPSSSTSSLVRIIPGHVGLVQRAKLLKANVFILDPDGALMSTQEYMQKVVEDVDKDSDFNGGHSTTTFSQATSTSPSSSPTPSTTLIYYGGSSTNTECSSSKHLLGRIKVLQATLEMYRHPEQHTLNSATLLHDLNNDMEKLGLE
nr:hypothetical protein [Tanacetum cinerariifolium]